MIHTVGSICSGIEAASVAWKPLGFVFKWFSEIAPFPSQVLHERFPDVINVGDMNNLPDALENESIYAPDLICGGTPCQAFSLAGSQRGLMDERGNLTLKFVEIINSNDKVRLKQGKRRSIVFFENVEGVLKDKTNAFGCLISSLAGLDNIIEMKSWPNAGVLRGKLRNVAWRVLDAKYFGLPQQRRRLYVIAGDKKFSPENILFELHNGSLKEFPSTKLTFRKDGHEFEVFREYSDCLYSAYGTKWNGNAAAYNGSLFVVQDGFPRRLSPLECERLMGFPDDYTNVKGANRTNRYKAIGNSWAVPVIREIGLQLISEQKKSIDISKYSDSIIINDADEQFYDLSGGIHLAKNGEMINCSEIPEKCTFKTLPDIISSDAPKSIYISPVGCQGIIRRKRERNLGINKRLEDILLKIVASMPAEEIEKRSRVQRRGKFSVSHDKGFKQKTIFET